MTSPTRVGLLGAGYIAEWHAKALKTIPGVRLVAVCDQSRARAAALANAHGVARTHVDLADMLADGGVDCVHVLLPPQAHARATRDVLAAGAAAYLEKPMCVRPDEVAELEALAATGRVLGVGHNFLFDPNYDRLKADLAAGRLGRVEHVSVVWVKEFGPARAGPFGGWVFRRPGNILLEVGPHPVANVLDLVGDPDRLRAEAIDPVLLPSGERFFRRWLVWSFHGRASVEMRLCFGSGFPEHRVEVRGTAGTATVDYERGTYVLRRRSPLSDDFDRYVRTRDEGLALVRQGRRNLARYALSKFRLAKDGNAFGASISRALRQFYADFPAVKDSRLTAAFGGRVVRTCLDVATAAGLDATEERSPEPRAVARAGTSVADVLVLGGSGFIGKALVRRLVDGGKRVRVLARDPGSIPASLRNAVEVVAGDASQPSVLAAALRDVPAVVHLARSRSRTWEQYVRDEIGVTRTIAEAALNAGVKRFVYTGTTDSYFSGRPGPITDATPLDAKIHRRNLYARAKAESEAVLQTFHREMGLPLVIARPAIVVGPGGDPHHWGVGMWPSPDTCLLWGRGDTPLPLVLADDVADALARCLDADGVVGESFNLAAPASVTGREYVSVLAESLGSWIDARPVPPWRFFAGDLGKWAVKCVVRHPDRRLPSYRDWKSRTYRATFDCSKAERVLGWDPTSDREKLLELGVRRAAAEWSA